MQRPCQSALCHMAAGSAHMKAATRADITCSAPQACPTFQGSRGDRGNLLWANINGTQPFLCAPPHTALL